MDHADRLYRYAVSAESTMANHMEVAANYIRELEAQLAEAQEFIDFCQSLTGSMWPQNETTEKLAVALRQSPIVKALAGKEVSDER